MHCYPAVLLAALDMLGAAHHAAAAESSSLRGLRAPALIEFAPADAYRPGMPLWQPGGETQASLQPSALYGLRERLPSGTAQATRFSYSYSDSVTGVFESGPATQDPYTTTYALSGQLVHSFDSGLGVGLGLRQRQAGSNVVAIAVQQGWGPVSGAYTMYSGRNDGTPAPSHRLALNFNYGNRSSVGLSYTAGRDLQPGMLPLAPGMDSRDLALSGHHWLAPQWAVTYDVVNSDQAVYRRQGLRFGIRHMF